MRASDLKLPEGMEVYVDMDGVVADFFAEYAKLAGVQNGNYRDIPPAKVDPTLNKMIGTDFFFRLPKFPTADKLLQIVVDAAGGYNICSSPLRGDHENSGVQKKRWIQKHLNPQPSQIYIVANKAKYAKNSDGMPNVLIDDRGSNISAWEAAGGIGIKYQADEDSLKVILDGLKRARRVGKGEQQHDPQKLTSLDRGKMIAVHSSGDRDEAHENMDHTQDDQAVPELKSALIAHKKQLQSSNDDQVYDIIDKIMTRIAKSHGISGQKLHNMWVKKYGQIPDTWIMKVSENFADGKNPGRKGLAKRSGVNTKASVSSLRNTAKHSTGEKARMAHWLANMKAGRAKHK